MQNFFRCKFFSFPLNPSFLLTSKAYLKYLDEQTLFHLCYKQFEIFNSNLSQLLMSSASIGPFCYISK